MFYVFIMLIYVHNFSICKNVTICFLFGKATMMEQHLKGLRIAASFESKFMHRNYGFCARTAYISIYWTINEREREREREKHIYTYTM